MVYIALGVVALSVSFYVISYGKPKTLLSFGWRKPGATPQEMKTGTAQRLKPTDEKEQDAAEANAQLSNELQDTQENADRSRSESPQTTPKARTQGAEHPQSIPSFTLDGANDEPTEPAGRLRIDRSKQGPIPSSPRSPKRQPPAVATMMMPPPPLPIPTAQRKAESPLSSQTMQPLKTKPISSISPMPPPSRPARPPSSTNLMPPPSAASTLRKPPTSASLAPTSSSLPASSRPSKKVILSPGHSPLDWAALVASPPTPSFLRGNALPPHLIKVPPSMLKYHNGRKDPSTGKLKDAWGVWGGKVYNMTPYLDFHPGGRGEMLRGAGKEETVVRKLFDEVHPWINWEGMLGNCLVGILVSEGGEGEGGMDEMD